MCVISSSPIAVNKDTLGCYETESIMYSTAVSLLPIWGAADSYKKKTHYIMGFARPGVWVIEKKKQHMPSKSSVNMSVNLLTHGSAVMVR